MRFLKYIFCALLFVTASVADTININWTNDGATYAQTTCEIGGDIILPTTPTKRGYTFKGWSVDVPDGYDRLEYIESTGTQWINTQTTGGTWEVLAQSNTNLLSTQSQILFYNNISAGNWAGYASSVGLYDFGIQSSFVSEKYLYTGNNKAISNPILFVGNTREYHYFGRVWYLKIKKEGICVRYFIPARRLSDGVIGMFDIVTDQFFKNQGTGEFIAGPVIDGL